MRIDGKGQIDRSRPIKIAFDGQNYTGFQGDTVASLLLANGVRLVGRSFKYHRPRGILTAGSEEPNALITTGSGAYQTPNVRATMAEAFDGLETHSQNNWPSLNTDILAINDLMSPFFGAGFYYKTFMWPPKFWFKLYEPFIRRAAGLGQLSGENDTDRYEKAFAHCDLLIIGAGPAGLTAALMAGRAGVDVILADEMAAMGGRLLSETEAIGGKPASAWVAETLAELATLPNVRLMARTAVTGAYDGGIYGALERVACHVSDPGDAPLECFWRIHTKRALLCAGALERPIAFPNNDRPGVMMASAVRSYLNRYGVAPGKRITILANNDNAHRTATDLTAAGIEVAALVDTRPDAIGPAGIPFYPGAFVDRTRGRHGLSEIRIRQMNGSHLTVQTDCLAMSGGWNPTLHIACHTGARPQWNDAIAAFVPTPDMVPGLDFVGAALGVFSTKGAMKSAQYRTKLSLEALGVKAPSLRLPDASDAEPTITAYWAAPSKGRAWLDFQNDVTTKDVKLAAQENFRSVEHMKRYTTQGMATDQGKNSNINALAVLAEATARTIAESGTTTYRPPFAPVTLAALGAGGQGHGFAPERLMTSHAASLERHAPMIEAGLWFRPSYFPKPNETTWRQSCDREVKMVRQSVGITDVSTLGKIDIQGRDAGRFLDFVYTNTFSTLRPGRIRYGLMLREDGFVMDDGTTACLAPNHYVMTTTTAAAGQVMKHLDHARQVHVPDWDVQLISVTENWAQFAIAGPRAQDVVNAVTTEDVTDETHPFMSCGPVTISGVPARLFRISFSGERGYELAVPARFGDSLFRLLLTYAETLGGGAYGMEALNVLRIEKGFITHAEIHGRVTAGDIGMAGLMSAKKDFIGKTMAARPGLTDAAREQLVGLKPAGVMKQILPGAHLFNADADATRKNDQGYVTSACYSPTLETTLGLAFLKAGRARHGETIRMVDHLRGVTGPMIVCDPQFFDPEGDRARA